MSNTKKKLKLHKTAKVSIIYIIVMKEIIILIYSDYKKYSANKIKKYIFVIFLGLQNMFSHGQKTL